MKRGIEINFPKNTPKIILDAFEKHKRPDAALTALAHNTIERLEHIEKNTRSSICNLTDDYVNDHIKELFQHSIENEEFDSKIEREASVIIRSIGILFSRLETVSSRLEEITQKFQNFDKRLDIAEKKGEILSYQIEQISKNQEEESKTTNQQSQLEETIASLEDRLKTLTEIINSQEKERERLAGFIIEKVSKKDENRIPTNGYNPIQPRFNPKSLPLGYPISSRRKRPIQ